MMMAWDIPQFWLTGLGSWAVSYLLHSSVLLGLVLLLCRLGLGLSESRKDVLLKMALVAGVFTASIQFIQSSNGDFFNTIVFDISPSTTQSYGKPVSSARVIYNAQLHYIAQESLDIPHEQHRRVQVNWLDLLLLLWLVGALGFALRFVWRWYWFKQQIGQLSPLNHQPTIELCQQLQQKMGIARRLTFSQSGQINSPMAIGLSHVCLPKGMWLVVDEEQMTAIVAHELAHISRLDPIWLFFWHLMSIVFFFQPLNKLTQLSFQARAEFLADAMAVRQTKDPHAMVNSLLSAAQWSNKPILASLSSQLLGHNATIVNRAKMLLAEKLITTKVSLAFVVVSAFLFTTLAMLLLPGVSLASRPVNERSAQWVQFTEQDSYLWTEFSNNILRFQTNLEYVESIAGRHIELSTKRVTFAYDLNGIAKFGPFARLRFVSKSIYGSTSLEISVNWQNKPLYRFKVNGQLVDDPQAANAFIGQMLDLALGQSDEFKRNVLQAYAQSQPQKRQISSIISAQVEQILAQHGDGFSGQELQFAQAMANTPELFDLALPFDGVPLPQSLLFFNAMAISQQHTGSFSELGLLNITHKQADKAHLNIQYDLNNKRLLQLFLATNGLNYQAGISEKALVDFLVRLHFTAPADNIRWLEE